MSKTKLKHLHILLGFPNTYFAKLNSLGEIDNLNSVTNEVKLMMNPDTAFSNDASESDEIDKFGSSDVMDLNRLQLLKALCLLPQILHKLQHVKNQKRGV